MTYDMIHGVRRSMHYDLSKVCTCTVHVYSHPSSSNFRPRRSFHVCLFVCFFSSGTMPAHLRLDLFCLYSSMHAQVFTTPCILSTRSTNTLGLSIALNFCLLFCLPCLPLRNYSRHCCGGCCSFFRQQHNYLLYGRKQCFWKTCPLVHREKSSLIHGYIHSGWVQ